MLKIIYQEITNLTTPPCKLKGSLSPGDAGLDSLSFVALIVALEDRLGFVLDDELADISSIKTLRQLAQKLEKIQNQAKELKE